MESKLYFFVVDLLTKFPCVLIIEKADKLPTESMWRETGQDFLYHVLLAAKKALRGELWVATSSCNGEQLKNLVH